MRRFRADWAQAVVKHRKRIERIFLVLLVVSLLGLPLVGIQYDLTQYLPEEAPTAQAIAILKEEFTYPGAARVMLNDVSLYEAKGIKDQIAQVEGVDMVSWCDTGTLVYGSDQFIDYGEIDDYYKDGQAYMEIAFVESDASDATHQAVQEIRAIVGDRGIVGGSAVADADQAPTTNAEVSSVMGMAVMAILLILVLTTTSWFEPVLFMTVMAVAILLNMGTNLMFGSISFLANAVGAVLQLACSMDYSIFLLHTYTKICEEEPDQEKAMALALRKALPSIGASGATTIVGFLALALMRFRIGADMGFVLAKGIAISLLTVLLLMPALILRFQRIIRRTAHRSFVPSFSRMGRGIYRARVPVFLCVILLMPFCYLAQSNTNYSYGNEGVTGAPGTAFYENEERINRVFGQSNVLLALVPVGDNLTEQDLTVALEDLPYVRYATSLTDTLPEGVPEEFLPRSLTSQLHSAHWARIMVSVRSSGESTAAYTYADEVRGLLEDYYPGQQTYLVGATPSAQDIRDIITADYSRVNVISLLGVALVVAITYRKALLPLVVILPIEAAIFLNTAFPYIMGEKLIYLGFIIVGCIQLGATIDYSILMTGNYLAARQVGDKRESAIYAISASSLSILTSGSILTCVGYGLYFMTTNGATSSLGHLLGRGAILSTAMVLVMLPACLTFFDPLVTHSLRSLLQKRFRRKKPKALPAEAASLQKDQPIESKGGEHP